MSIRVADPKNPVVSLSGGNQQKVVVAKGLLTNPKVLMLDEPTRGIDVGAKHEIFEIMEDLAEQGYGVLFVSSELKEILAMSDRILVMSKGLAVLGVLVLLRAGQVSFGHAMFFAISAYSAAFL